MMEENQLDFAAAREAVAAGTCLHDAHARAGRQRRLRARSSSSTTSPRYLPQLKIDWQRVLRPGPAEPARRQRTVLHDRAGHAPANTTNGVSKLHGEVSRKMWRAHLARTARGRNSHHVASPTASTPRPGCPTKCRSFTTATSASQLGRASRPITASGTRVDNIPDAGIVAHPRTPPRTAGGLRPRNVCEPNSNAAAPPPAEIARADEVLDPEALTIGFARRFATYKRGTLLFRNLDRLAAHPQRQGSPGADSSSPARPIPRDNGGKELIAEIIHVCRRPEFRRRMVFIEDYDMNVARYLVQGVDVWLNNPRRPLEASGTSGMKAAVNGGLNLSILDGWWVEGYDRRQRLGHRRRRGIHRPDLPGRRREPGHLRPARTGNRAALLQPLRPTACRAAGSRP